MNWTETWVALLYSIIEGEKGGRIKKKREGRQKEGEMQEQNQNGQVNETENTRREVVNG